MAWLLCGTTSHPRLRGPQSAHLVPQPVETRGQSRRGLRPSWTSSTVHCLPRRNRETAGGIPITLLTQPDHRRRDRSGFNQRGVAFIAIPSHHYVGSQEQLCHMSTAVVPSLDHFKFSDYDEFYEPGEDTFLLLDTLLHDMDMLCASKAKLCVEIG